MTLARGLYEQLLTELIQRQIDGQPTDRSVELSKLHPAEAPDRFALHLVEGLTDLITGNDVWARRVLKELDEHVGGVQRIRALGFCVSVAHARYMARVFNEHGVAAKAIWADTPGDERRGALNALRRGEVKIDFSVDLPNEGVDVPVVDTLLLLRPTDSSILFLQQHGRGLRKAPDRAICTVLAFVGQHRKEFRYDRRFQVLPGGTRRMVTEQVELLQHFSYCQ